MKAQKNTSRGAGEWSEAGRQRIVAPRLFMFRCIDYLFDVDIVNYTNATTRLFPRKSTTLSSFLWLCTRGRIRAV